METYVAFETLDEPPRSLLVGNTTRQVTPAMNGSRMHINTVHIISENSQLSIESANYQQQNLKLCLHFFQSLISSIAAKAHLRMQ